VTSGCHLIRQSLHLSEILANGGGALGRCCQCHSRADEACTRLGREHPFNSHPSSGGNHLGGDLLKNLP
jgi:hypothetical protein